MSASLFRALFTAAALLTGCSRGERQPSRQAAPGTLPQRIVSLGPSGTEILAALGATSRMVGRSRWDRWPDAVLQVPEVGDAIRPSVERIVAARPDLVVLYAAADNVAAVQALTQADVRVVSLRIDTIDDFLAAVDSLGALVGATARADSIISTLRAQLDAVRAMPHRGRPRVFMPVWEQPLMTVGAGSFLSELLTIAGAENVYADAPAPSLTVSLEDVVRRDPDVVLTSPNGAERIRRSAQWRGLRAVREGHIATYDTTLVSQPSTRLGEAARSLALLLRPPDGR